MSREEWCPTCTIDPTVEYTTPSHLIVHHSAGANSSSDWPAVVRAIWDYHVNVRGWDDIGYNWLIDPQGTLYIGRADNVRGAHFCGFNSNTMGCCMMGTYTTTLPTVESRETLIGLLAWKSVQMNIDPLASSYHSSSSKILDHIAGHRQGCSTECPGSQFYASFSNVRNEVQAFIDEECVEEEVLPSEISMSPNPNFGFFTFQNPFEESLDLFIYAMDGKLVFKKYIPALSNSFIKLQQRSSGIYHVIAIGPSVKWEERMVVH